MNECNRSRRMRMTDILCVLSIKANIVCEAKLIWRFSYLGIQLDGVLSSHAENNFMGTGLGGCPAAVALPPPPLLP